MGDDLDPSWSDSYSWADFEATNGLPALPAFGHPTPGTPALVDGRPGLYPYSRKRENYRD